MFKVRYISRLTADLTVVWRRQMDQIRHDTVAALGHNRCHCWLSPFSLFSSLFPQPPGTTTATITIIIIITLTSGSLLGRSEVLRSLRHYLRAQSRGHHSTDRLEERGVERGSARRSSLKGRERAIVNQTNIRTVSKATFGKLPRDWVERIWTFPSS